MQENMLCINKIGGEIKFTADEGQPSLEMPYNVSLRYSLYGDRSYALVF